jgi:hypothetical protein
VNDIFILRSLINPPIELNIALHHSFIFDVVIANLGNGYNKHTGAFIVPQDGVYVLTLTIFPNRGTITSVHILRNREVIIINHILTNFHLFYYDAYYN